MEKGRLEAFSDGVIAIIITIMVLELKAPREGSWHALSEMGKEFLSYVLSFLYVGIYWNNHHHLLKAARRVNGGILWANLHLLFWLSLVPFTTAWMSRSHEAPPVILYGVNLLLSAVAYSILQWRILEEHGRESKLREAIGHDWKGKLSLLLYFTAILLTLFLAELKWIAEVIYVLVAVIWLVPDRRVARAVHE